MEITVIDLLNELKKCTTSAKVVLAIREGRNVVKSTINENINISDSGNEVYIVSE